MNQLRIHIHRLYAMLSVNFLPYIRPLTLRRNEKLSASQPFPGNAGYHPAWEAFNIILTSSENIMCQCIDDWRGPLASSPDRQVRTTYGAWMNGCEAMWSGCSRRSSKWLWPLDREFLRRIAFKKPWADGQF